MQIKGENSENLSGLEGCYPYVFGGVSTWMHQYINQMQEHEFVLWVIGANAEKEEICL